MDELGGSAPFAPPPTPQATEVVWKNFKNKAFGEPTEGRDTNKSAKGMGMQQF